MTNLGNFIKGNNPTNYYKVKDLTLINYLETTKHSIIGYSLLYCSNYGTLNNSLIPYKSPITGNLDIGFNSNPQPFILSKVFNKILDNFTSTECKGLRNRTLKESLDLVVNKPLTLIVKDKTYLVTDAKHINETKLDDTDNYVNLTNEITFNLTVDLVKSKHVIKGDFISQRKMLRSIEQYINEL